MKEENLGENVWKEVYGVDARGVAKYTLISTAIAQFVNCDESLISGEVEIENGVLYMITFNDWPPNAKYTGTELKAEDGSANYKIQGGYFYGANQVTAQNQIKTGKYHHFVDAVVNLYNCQKVTYVVKSLIYKE